MGSTQSTWGSYEYSDFLEVEFDAYMVPTADLETNGFRLLDVDNRTVLPMNTQIRFLINGPGLFYGQCSEICGANHRFMPIVVERVSISSFLDWISSARD